MVKRGALSKVEKYYIEGNATLPVEDIAKELDRSTNIISKHLDVMGVEPPAEPTQATVEPVEEEGQMFQVMGRHERKGEKVATVMTSAASELADATRSKRGMNKKLQEAIHIPFKNKNK